jgi:carboxypeptidase C (cathepsin A)
MILGLCVSTTLHAEAEPSGSAAGTSDDLNVAELAASVTHHSGIFHSHKITYTATAGRVPIRAADGSVDAQMFYVAYTMDSAKAAERPLVFLSNGGPGAATAWMHLGGIGPAKIKLNTDGSTPPLPVRVIPNPESILDRADLVFIDAPGTGYSRVASEAAKVRLFAKAGDLAAFADFIHQYLGTNNRWASPVYLFGESYGGMRMAGLTDVLIRRGIPLKGAILLSSLIDDQVVTPSAINDLPYQLLLPSYASVAAFHGRTAPDAPKDGDALRQEAATWALQEYGPALAKGNRLSEEERKRIAMGLARFTGLSLETIESENLRVNVPSFMQHLLQQPGIVVGRVDGRASGPAPSNRVEEPFYDPAMGSLTPAFSSATSQYLIDELHYSAPLAYRMYSQDVASRFALAPAAQYGEEGYPQALPALQSTLVKNADFRVLTLNGLYDLATPYWNIEYSLDHMALPASYREHATSVRLHGGHMAYADARGLSELSTSVSEFIARDSNSKGQ